MIAFKRLVIFYLITFIKYIENNLLKVFNELELKNLCNYTSWEGGFFLSRKKRQNLRSIIIQ